MTTTDFTPDNHEGHGPRSRQGGRPGSNQRPGAHERPDSGRRPHGFDPSDRMPHGRDGAAPFGPFSPGFPFGGPGGGRSPWGRFARGIEQEFRARRGDVRYLILQVLADGPANGYTIIKKAGEFTEGAWSPSPGSVYPTLSLLSDEGLVKADESSSYSLTDAGQALLDSPQGEQFRTRLGDLQDRSSKDELGTAIQKLIGSLMQLRQLSSAEARTEAAEKVDALRRDLYKLLSEQ